MYAESRQELGELCIAIMFPVPLAKLWREVFGFFFCGAASQFIELVRRVPFKRRTNV